MPPNSFVLKTNSVKLVDANFKSTDILKSLANDIGKKNILGCVKTQGQWILTVKNKEDAELIQETGLKIGNEVCDIMGVTKTIITVSVFGVPMYITDDEISGKLEEYGCRLRSPWVRKYYEDYPNIENGIRYVRLELPNSVKSLPYAITIEGTHLRLKHNGQSRVCNLCLSDDHIMRECPQYTCRECGQQGHSRNRCPEILCYKCNKLGHTSYHCDEKDDTETMDEDTEIENPIDKPTTYEDTEKPTTYEAQESESRPANTGVLTKDKDEECISDLKERSRQTKVQPITESELNQQVGAKIKRTLSSNDGADWIVVKKNSTNQQQRKNIPRPNVTTTRRYHTRERERTEPK